MCCPSHRAHGPRPYVDPDVALATVGSSGFAGHESDTSQAVPRRGVEVILTVAPTEAMRSRMLHVGQSDRAARDECSGTSPATPDRHRHGCPSTPPSTPAAPT
jgi:hypothetical protein